MKVFAAIGIAISVMSIAGMFGFGHFRIIYSPYPIECIKESKP